MPQSAIDIALRDCGPRTRAPVQRFEHSLAQNAAFLATVENDDIAVNDGFHAELALYKGEVSIELAEHIGELAVVVES